MCGRYVRPVPQLVEDAGVVLGEGRDAMAGLLGYEGQAAALPREQGDDRAAQAADPHVAADARRLRSGLVDPPAPVLPVVELPRVAVVRGEISASDG